MALHSFLTGFKMMSLFLDATAVFDNIINAPQELTAAMTWILRHNVTIRE